MIHTNRRPLLVCLMGLGFATGLATVPAAWADTPAPKTDPKGDTKGDAGLVDLRPKFERGATSRYIMQVDSKTKTKDPKDAKKTVDSSMSQAIGLKMKVVDVKDGEATVELVYESMKISVKTADAEMNYDSEAKPKPGKKSDGLDDQDLFAPIFKQIVGTTMTMTVDSNGNIKDIKGGDALNLLGSIPGGSPVDPKSLGGLFGPISSSAAGKGKYKVGEKWTNQDSLSVGPLGDFKMTTEHTLVSHRAGRADVTVAGKADAKSESDAAMSPDKFKLKNATYRGKYTWDTSRGRLISMDLEQSTAIGGQLDAQTTSTMKITERK